MVVEGRVDDRRLIYWRPELLNDDAPDTGSLAGDLDAIVKRAKRNDNALISNDLVLRSPWRPRTIPSSPPR